MSPSEDWPDGLAYLINRLEAEADTFTTPGDAWRQCKARFISLKQRRLAASLEPEAAELVIETDSNSAKPLRKREQTVLRILSQHGPELMTSAEISQHSESGEHGELVGVRTVGLAVKTLVDLGLAERPISRGEGMRLTKLGKKRAQALPPASR
jgi:putative heme degradation protein